MDLRVSTMQTLMQYGMPFAGTRWGSVTFSMSSKLVPPVAQSL